jgi:hypothetical protein
MKASPLPSGLVEDIEKVKTNGDSELGRVGWGITGIVTVLSLRWLN